VAVSWKLTVLRADGTDAGTYDVPSNVTLVGRESGGIFGGDSYLSPQHAKLTVRDGKLFVEDAGSLNGTYIKLKRDVSEFVADGQFFRIGQEIIRFEKLHPDAPVAGVEKMGSPSTGYIGRIVLVTGRGTDGNAFPVPQLGVHIGRERGHVLFPEDGYVSGLHCSLTVKDGEVFLTDLGSSNGSFVRLTSEREVLDGDILLMGQQLFRASL
jgi:pSer/pThr/pTyr-binding forkhead associated (FHA) protein